MSEESRTRTDQLGASIIVATLLIFGYAGTTTVGGMYQALMVLSGAGSGLILMTWLAREVDDSER